MPKIWNVHVIPNSKTVHVEQISDDSLEVKLKSIAQKGKANKELIGLLSDFFKVKKDCVHIIKGELSRNKIVLID